MTYDDIIKGLRTQNNLNKWFKEDCENLVPGQSGMEIAYTLGYKRAKHKAFWKFRPVKNEDGQIYVHCYVCTNCKAVDEHQGAASYCWNCGAEIEGRLD